MARDKVLQIRLSSGEHESIRAAAETAGLGMSEFLRRSALEDAEGYAAQRVRLARERERVERNPAFKNVTLDDSGALVVKEPGKSASVGALRCPASGCAFTAASPAARCPVHGRIVR